MFDALYIGATGMHAQQMHVDTIANNLANVNTAGFKKNRVSFEDMMYRASSAAMIGAENLSPVVIGLGTHVANTSKSFMPGELKATESPFDFAIRGAGFFEVVMPDGERALTRHGTFRVTAEGLLGTQEGYLLSSDIRVPADALEVVVEDDGRVLARLPGEQDLVDLGQIELVMVSNPEGLDPLGGNLFRMSELAGSSRPAVPTRDGAGAVVQGYLEASNVELAEEMVNLVLAQRAYELNAKVIQASDDMLSISNNLRR